MRKSVNEKRCREGHPLYLICRRNSVITGKARQIILIRKFFVDFFCFFQHFFLSEKSRALFCPVGKLCG